MDALESRLRKPGADFADVAQLTAVSIMQPQEQGAECIA